MVFRQYYRVPSTLINLLLLASGTILVVYVMATPTLACFLQISLYNLYRFINTEDRMLRLQGLLRLDFGLLAIKPS